jgi:hypothetical protein
MRRPAIFVALAMAVAGQCLLAAAHAAADPPSAEDTLLGGSIFEGSGEIITGGRNTATLAQQGSANQIALNQTIAPSATVTNVAALVQAGDGNDIDVTQSGQANTAHLTQVGNNNSALAVQHGSNNLLAATQIGNSIGVTVTQYGGAVLSIVQTGQ